MQIQEENVVRIGQTKQGRYVEVFNDVITLNKCHLWERDEGDVWVGDWAFPQERQHGETVPAKKAKPINLYLGQNKHAAVSYLKKLQAIIMELADDGEIPF